MVRRDLASWGRPYASFRTSGDSPRMAAKTCSRRLVACFDDVIRKMTRLFCGAPIARPTTDAYHWTCCAPLRYTIFGFFSSLLGQNESQRYECVSTVAILWFFGIKHK